MNIDSTKIQSQSLHLSQSPPQKKLSPDLTKSISHFTKYVKKSSSFQFLRLVVFIVLNYADLTTDIILLVESFQIKELMDLSMVLVIALLLERYSNYQLYVQIETKFQKKINNNPQETPKTTTQTKQNTQKNKINTKILLKTITFTEIFTLLYYQKRGLKLGKHLFHKRLLDLLSENLIFLMAAVIHMQRDFLDQQSLKVEILLSFTFSLISLVIIYIKLTSQMLKHRRKFKIINYTQFRHLPTDLKLYILNPTIFQITKFITHKQIKKFSNQVIQCDKKYSFNNNSNNNENNNIGINKININNNNSKYRDILDNIQVDRYKYYREQKLDIKWYRLKFAISLFYSLVIQLAFIVIKGLNFINPKGLRSEMVVIIGFILFSPQWLIYFKMKLENVWKKSKISFFQIFFRLILQIPFIILVGTFPFFLGICNEKVPFLSETRQTVVNNFLPDIYIVICRSIFLAQMYYSIYENVLVNKNVTGFVSDYPYKEIFNDPYSLFNIQVIIFHVLTILTLFFALLSILDAIVNAIKNPKNNTEKQTKLPNFLTEKQKNTDNQQNIISGSDQFKIQDQNAHIMNISFSSNVINQASNIPSPQFKSNNIISFPTIKSSRIQRNSNNNSHVCNEIPDQINQKRFIFDLNNTVEHISIFPEKQSSIMLNSRERPEQIQMLSSHRCIPYSHGSQELFAIPDEDVRQTVLNYKDNKFKTPTFSQNTRRQQYLRRYGSLNTDRDKQ